MPYLTTNVPEQMAAQALELAQLRALYITKARQCNGGQRGYYTRRIKGIAHQLVHIADTLIQMDGYHMPMPYTCIKVRENKGG